MTEQPHKEGTFAGYRLVRKLGSGSRADVYLAVGSAGSVALKVFMSGVDRDSVGREMDALSRVDSQHLVRLRDLTDSGSEVPSLVLDRIQRGSVTSLLRDRESLERGEAVTLLAPLARLVTELQGAGIAHGNVGASSVYLGDGGEPVLIGLGHATLFAAGLSPAALDAEPAATADRDALASLSLALLDRVRDTPGDARTAELARWIETEPTAYEFPAALEERLFDWATGMPVAFTRSVDAISSVPSRVAPLALSIREKKSELEPSPPGESSGRSWLPVELVENPFGEIRRRVADFARGVRRPYWIVAAAVVLGLVFALAFIPSGGSSAPPRAVSTASIASPRARPTQSSLPSDPLLALPLLLKLREACFRDLSVLCLDGVDEASSGAFSTDAAAIQQIQNGGEIPVAAKIDAPPIALVERLGDSALFSLGGATASPPGTPVSVLVIKTANGWRIRDILTGAQATPHS